MASDLEIARKATLRPIEEVAHKAGFSADTLSAYGRYVAKVDAAAYLAKPARAKLVLVTAMNPTVTMNWMNWIRPTFHMETNSDGFASL